MVFQETMLTISFNLTATLVDEHRYSSFGLPLAWITLPVDKWRRLTQRLRTAAVLVGIGWRSLAWGVF